MYHVLILEPEAAIVELYRRQITATGLSDYIAARYAATSEEAARLGAELATSAEGLSYLVVDADAFAPPTHAVRKACDLIRPLTSYRSDSQTKPVVVFVTGFEGSGREEFEKVGVRGEVEKLSLVGEIRKLLKIPVHT